MIVQELPTKTSAQIALEDKTFHELFGMIWENKGFTIENAQDLSWAIFYKDMFLQGLADYTNRGFVKVADRYEFLVNQSAIEWVENDSPFNIDEERNNLQRAIDKISTWFYSNKRRKDIRTTFSRKIARYQATLSDADAFSFNCCCAVLGLDVDKARECFKSYRNLKVKYGDRIRIVTYTGTKKKNLNIPSLQDIIDAEEVNGKHDLPLFLHVGIKRELRNRALVRSRNERSDKRDSE